MKLLRFLLFLLLFGISQGMLAQYTRWEDAKADGMELYKKGEFQEAEKKFKAALRCRPKPDAKQSAELDSLIKVCERSVTEVTVNEVTVNLWPNKLVFSARPNEEQRVEVKTTAKSFTMSPRPDWCTVVQGGKYLYVTCEDNGKISERKCDITITAEGKKAILKVSQRPADLKVEFLPSSLEFSGQGDSKTVNVQTNATNWTVKDYPTWMVVDRIGDELRIVCEKNTLNRSRSANVEIEAEGASYSLYINQLPGDAVLEIAGQTREVVLNDVDPRGGFVVKSNMSDWKVYPMDDWITASRKQDSVIVTAKVNPSVLSRHGKVRVSCQNRQFDVSVHQRPHVSDVTMPESELKVLSDVGKESVSVSSYPPDLVVYVDNSITMTTPFQFCRDYEYHSLNVGFESWDFIFNEDQKDIVFNPGLRFAALSFTAPKNIGLRTGFISANNFGAYSHFQASRPLVNQFASDTTKADGYHFMVGPVYSPIQYAAVYGGLGVGIHEGPTMNGVPNVKLDYEAGLMGFFKNATVSMGFRTTRWGFNDNERRTTFVFGVGGYLKRYYDPVKGYCTSDSRRWVSLNYMFRPAAHGKGMMIGDMGKEKLRTYVKAMYVHPSDSLRNVEASFGFVFTPVNGIIDFCVGAGANTPVSSFDDLSMDVEAGFIVNLWRIPLTVMLHESDILRDNRHLYVDFGIGFHLGEFNRSSYK